MRAIRNAWLLLLLAACSSAPPPRLPAWEERANTLDEQGYRAMHDGNFLAAQSLFEQELRLHQSLDNLPGVAAAAINLATVYHRLGNDGPALQLLDRIGNEVQIPYPAELRAAALFRKAVILLDAGKMEKAESVLGDAMGLCEGSCKLMAGIRNLQARLAFSKKDYAATLELAKKATDAAGDQKSELANAKRIAAAAELATGQNDTALQHYQSALGIDKKLGLSGRIADDLDGVASALEQLGRKEEAAGYARRAGAAHEALHPGVGKSVSQ